MAKGKKTGGRDWVKGVSGNPLGPPKLPQELKEARKLNKQEIVRVLNRFLGLTKTELSDISENPATPSLELFVAELIRQGIYFGDQKRLSFILDRLIGKVPDEVDMRSTHEVYAETLPTSELLKEASVAIQFLSRKQDKEEEE